MMASGHAQTRGRLNVGTGAVGVLCDVDVMGGFLPGWGGRAPSCDVLPQAGCSGTSGDAGRDFVRLGQGFGGHDRVEW